MNLLWSLVYSADRVIVEVGLDHAPVLCRNLSHERQAGSKYCRAFKLGPDSIRINDEPKVSDDFDPWDFDLPILCNLYFDDVGYVGEKTAMRRDAETTAGRQLSPPVGIFRNLFGYVAQTTCIDGVFLDRSPLV